MIVKPDAMQYYWNVKLCQASVTFLFCLFSLNKTSSSILHHSTPTLLIEASDNQPLMNWRNWEEEEEDQDWFANLENMENLITWIRRNETKAQHTR